MVDNRETKGLIIHHQGEFLYNYYTFVSLRDSNHEGVVRIFVALSCNALHSVLLILTSGNRNPGSRFYSDLVDTLADSVCLHQASFKGCLYNVGGS